MKWNPVITIHYCKAPQTGSTAKFWCSYTLICSYSQTSQIMLVDWWCMQCLWLCGRSDEIYCQLCCVVTKNPSAESRYRGWMLHLFCAGCFLPSIEVCSWYMAMTRTCIVALGLLYTLKSVKTEDSSVWWPNIDRFLKLLLWHTHYSSKLAIKWSIQISPHVKRVATLYHLEY